MKLSELKALVAALEAAKTTEDPLVNFWISRGCLQPVGPKETELFVNFDLDLNAILSKEREHQVVTCEKPDTVYALGDYTLPLKVTPFYS